MKEYSLGDLLKLKNGKGSINKKRVESGDIPIHGSRGVEGYTDEKLYEESVIVIARVGEYAGSVHMTNSESWVTDNAIVARPSDNSKITKKFAFYLLKDMDLNRYTGGSAQSLLTQTSIKSIDVEIPNIEKQKKIVSLLDSIDRKIELNRELAELLEETAHAIYESWFEAYEPYDIPDDQEMPDILKKTSMGQVIEIRNGDEPEDHKMGGQYNIIGANGIIGTYQDYNEADSVIVGRVGTIGKAHRIKKRSWLSDNTMICKSDHDRIDNNLIYERLKNADLEKLNRGSTQPLLAQSDIEQQSIIVPDEKKAREFRAISENLYDMAWHLKEENKDLEELRDYLLPQLLRGEVVIQDDEDEDSDSANDQT